MDIRGLWSDPWCVGGDFNVVRLPSERRNCLNLFSTMKHFSEVIDELQLRDLPLTGGSYTWCGGLNNKSAYRLDRFLVLEDWECHFSNLSQSLLPKPTSDHAPILLDGGRIRGRKTPFRFENMWLKVEGFKDLVRKWWTCYNFSGSYSHILACKLKALKQDLKVWNIEVFGNVSLNKNIALSQIGFWDAKERDCGLSLEDCEARRRAVEEFSKWAVLEEISWRQKSREL